jgi:hypothetical protein
VEPLDDARVMPGAVALLDGADVPQARALPEAAMTAADVLGVALDRLEDFLLDVYEHGRIPGEPLVLWANGAPTMLREILDCFRCERLTADPNP